MRLYRRLIESRGVTRSVGRSDPHYVSVGRRAAIYATSCMRREGTNPAPKFRAYEH